MTTKSSSGDQSLMVDVQPVHSEVDEMAEVKADEDVNQPRSMLRMFSLPRGTAVASATSVSSKYSPMSEDWAMLCTATMQGKHVSGKSEKVSELTGSQG